MATRKNDVLSKLDYASDRFNALMTELFTAKKEGRDPKSLVHAAADVLSNSRECFDYLGQDILETYILPLSRNKKILDNHSQGKVKAYFPFYESQLKKNAIYAELRNTNPVLHQRLLKFAIDIKNNKRISDTLFECGMFEELKDIVNQKKHDRLVALISKQEAELFIEQPESTILIPRDGLQGGNIVAVNPGTKISKVVEYRFEHNKREVAEFCMFAHRATSIVVRGIYDDFFN
ncbi:hypothetical protein PTW35_08400 [Photobacterium sp. DA100]|uniref:hypothetical protein n=1 Tax=Photobacterium sp. DA100 TaxID=3027472 RepID=UPI00247856CB|nr:hypothetical protein [Photobacterium sp. DA100]WEM43784.1 hypothetical protein PTW35_08400 [Photobacterium sp. DA100]